MDKNHLKLLNKFAQTHTLAEHIKVDITEYCKSFKPKYETSYAKYEDCNLLSDIIRGAESFLYFLERNNYIIKKK